MNVNVNAQKVKRLRKQRLWSQDELAVACGVGLRTIQRVEGDGQASDETQRALAAVFNVDSSELINSSCEFRNYLNIQLGYAVIGIFLLIALAAAWGFRQSLIGEAEYWVLMSVCAVVLILFPSLTTRVEDGLIKWSFGVGLIRKSISLNRVSHSSVVRNKLWWGIGVRMIPQGWLYNVSGLSAVELQLDDGKRIRIGSDEPDKLNQAIISAQELISHT